MAIILLLKDEKIKMQGTESVITSTLLLVNLCSACCLPFEVLELNTELEIVIQNNQIWVQDVIVGEQSWN